LRKSPKFCHSARSESRSSIHWATLSYPVNTRTFKPRPSASDSTPSAQNDTTCLMQYQFRKKSNDPNDPMTNDPMTNDPNDPMTNDPNDPMTNRPLAKVTQILSFSAQRVPKFYSLGATLSYPVNTRTFKPRPSASDSTPSAQNDTTCLMQYQFRKKSNDPNDPMTNDPMTNDPNDPNDPMTNRPLAKVTQILSFSAQRVPKFYSLGATLSYPVNTRTFKPRPSASDSTPSAQNDTTCLMQYQFRKKSNDPNDH
jgi:hypothetical protein